jgi:hypothetical protein
VRRRLSRSLPRAGLVAVGLVVAFSGVSIAAISWGPQHGIPRGSSWNFGNALDFTGVPGTASLRLTDVFVSDAATPQSAFATSSHDGVSWTRAHRLSGKDVNAENPTIAAAGKKLIAGWMTGFSTYDPSDTPRRVQVVVSSDRGKTWGRPKGLSPKGGAVDYPVVAAAKTTFGGSVNLYAVWVDASTGKVTFRERSGASPWSAPISLGATTRKRSTGFSGFANIAATADLVAVAWIADASGTVKARAIDLSASGSPAAAATVTEWGPRTTMTKPVSLAQNGYPVVSASSLVPGVVTIAWNTSTSQVFAAVTGESIGSASTTIWSDGVAGGSSYTGGYGTVVEPAPGGFVAMWSACRDTTLVHDCNVRKPAARIDVLSATSSDGTTFGAPILVSPVGKPAQRINDAPSIVATSDHAYVQYDGATSSGAHRDVFARVAKGTP